MEIATKANNKSMDWAFKHDGMVIILVAFFNLITKESCATLRSPLLMD